MEFVVGTSCKNGMACMKIFSFTSSLCLIRVIKYIHGTEFEWIHVVGTSFQIAYSKGSTTRETRGHIVRYFV